VLHCPAILLLAAAVTLQPGNARAQAFADRVVAYQIGTGGGAGSDGMPGIVLGPPHGRGAFQGSTDTLSLGLGGWIVLEFTDGLIVDGPGADFTVFENPFLLEGVVTYPPFAEPGTVSVSPDGVEWRTFPCQLDTAPYYPGCAGVFPVFANADDPAAPSPFVPCSVPIQALVGVPVNAFPTLTCSGGDRFDLADLGLPAARFVRIDASQLEPGLAGTAGFDLDAIAAVHFATGPADSSTTTIPVAATTPEPCPAPGPSGVLCVLRTELPVNECAADHLPGAFGRLVDHASVLAARASATPKGRKSARLATVLVRRLAKITKLVGRTGGKHRLSSTCVAALERVLVEATGKLH
jgi:hypothetical protein